MSRPVTALRRFSTALVQGGRRKAAATDWWAVFVELVVVVVGILIAFELSNWGERRERRATEQLLLQRIDEEARGDLAALQDARGQSEQSASNARLLARAIGDPAARTAYARLGESQCNLLRLPAVRRHSSGSGGLAAGERLELISDLELRSRLRQADAERAFSDGQLDYFRQSFQRYSPLIEPHMPFTFDANGNAACAVDIGRLAKDGEAVAILPKVYRDQSRFAEYRGKEIDSTRAVLDRVRCLRRASCGD
jgi:hypothetical protein